MKRIARMLVENADSLSWLKYKGNVQYTDRLVQARYYRAAALLLLGDHQEAIGSLVTVSGATDWEWALAIQKHIWHEMNRAG